jgi:hypothetical protein
MKKVVLLVVALAMLGLAQMAVAQITNPAVNTAKISAVKGESLSISAVDVPQFSINPLATTSTSSQTLSITTLWNLSPSRNEVDVCASAGNLSPASSATNPDTISGDLVQINKSGSWTTLNAGAGCSAGTNVTVVNTYLLTNQTDRKSQTKTDNVQLQLAGLDPNLQADTYTGTITVYAYVQ